MSVMVSNYLNTSPSYSLGRPGAAALSGPSIKITWQQQAKTELVQLAAEVCYAESEGNAKLTHCVRGS